MVADRELETAFPAASVYEPDGTATAPPLAMLLIMLNVKEYVRPDPEKLDTEHPPTMVQYNVTSVDKRVVVASDVVNVTVVLSLEFNHTSSITTEVVGAVRSTTKLNAVELTDSSELNVAFAVTV